MARIDAQAALCKNFGDPTTFPVADLLAAIRKPSDRTRELVAAVRRAVAEGASKDAVASRKKDLPQVVWAATFNEKRRKDDVATYSGIVPLDFDGPDDPLALAARLAAEGIAAAAWISPSGTGVHALALLERPPATLAEYDAAWRNIATALAAEGMGIDESCKDPSRVLFASHGGFAECADPKRWPIPRETKRPQPTGTSGFADWLAVMERNRWRLRPNGEIAGPCPRPACPGGPGKDRVHIKDEGGRAIVGCRKCLDRDNSLYGDFARPRWHRPAAEAPRPAAALPRDRLGSRNAHRRGRARMALDRRDRPVLAAGRTPAGERPLACRRRAPRAGGCRTRQRALPSAASPTPPAQCGQWPSGPSRTPRRWPAG